MRGGEPLKRRLEPLSAAAAGEREGPTTKSWEGEVVHATRPTSPGSLPLATLSPRKRSERVS